MTKGQFRLLVVLTVVFGFLGGAVSNMLFHAAPALAAGTATPVQDEIRAKKFVLVDGEGRTKAELRVRADGGPVLAFLGPGGKNRAGIGLDKDGTPLLCMQDAAGNSRASLVLSAGGSPALEMYDAAGKMRAALDTTADANPGLTFYDSAGGFTASLSGGEYPDLWLGSAGTSTSLGAGILLMNHERPKSSFELLMFPNPCLALQDAAGKTRAMLELGSNGSPSLLLSDASGNTRTVVGCTRTVVKATDEKIDYPESTLTLFKDNGDVMWQAPTEAPPIVPSAPLGGGALPSLHLGIYPGVGGGHWIQEVMSNGKYIQLEDDSLWEISPIGQIDAALWLPVDNITVSDNRKSGEYPYLLINTDEEHEVVWARYLGD